MDVIAKRLHTNILVLSTAVLIALAQNGRFDVQIAEVNGIRMVSTSDRNYAIINPSFSQNWRTVSVNGNDVTIVTKDNQIITKSLMNLNDIERNELSQTKARISQVFQSNIINGMSSAAINIDKNQQQARLSTYSNSGSHASQLSSSSLMSTGDSNHISHVTADGLSFTMSGDNDFTIDRKNDMPFNWSNVFVYGDILTTVLNNGQVYMRPMTVLSQDELKEIELLRSEIRAASKQQQQQFRNTMQNSMNVMQNIMGNLLGQFNPIMAAAAGGTNNFDGGMFGRNFPFGPVNSPFDNGFPFGGTGAIAIAGN